MAGKAGYETLWLSNQVGSGLHDSLIKLIEQQADKLVYVTGQDDLLLKPFNEEVRQNKKQFIVLHLRGSHLGYENGHDEIDFERAKKSDAKYRHYDATISHTDRLLKSVTELLHKCPETLFVYVPDHGEIVNVGHGSPVLDSRQYEIPFVAWSQNKGLLSRFDVVVKRFSIQEANLFNTSSLPYAFSELMGYKIDKKVQKNSLEDSKYIFNVDGNAYPIELLK